MSFYERSFWENFHISVTNFEYIFELVIPLLEPKRKTRRDAIPPKLRLAMVLEYLASGCLERHVSSAYRVSKQSFGYILDEVCNAICIVLQDEQPDFTKTHWLQVANDFNARWNMPNCVGAIDGKHVAITCPKNAGSLFYNYKVYTYSK